MMDCVRWGTLTLTLALLLPVGCRDPGKDSQPQDSAAPSGQPAWRSIITFDAWDPTDAADDPFSDRPEKVDCSPLGYSVEGAAFEVQTDDCTYGTFRQPILAEVPAGTDMKFVIWHLDLWAAEPAEGHLAVVTDSDTLHEDFIAIPGNAAVYPIELAAPSDLNEGDWIYFHVHNHGYNAWSLGTIEAFLAP